MLRLGIDGGEVGRVLNEIDLEAGAGGEPGAGRVGGDVAEGAVNECVEDLAIAGSHGLRGVLSRSNNQSKRAHLVAEDHGKVERVCADSRPGDDIWACGGPPGRTTGRRDRVSCGQGDEGRKGEEEFHVEGEDGVDEGDEVREVRNVVSLSPSCCKLERAEEYFCWVFYVIYIVPTSVVHSSSTCRRLITARNQLGRNPT